MTRKHFEAIAAILRANHSPGASSQAVARDMADYLATQNPNFDRARFLKACGF